MGVTTVENMKILMFRFFFPELQNYIHKKTYWRLHEMLEQGDVDKVLLLMCSKNKSIFI